MIIPWGGRQIDLLAEQLEAVVRSTSEAASRGITAEVVVSCNAPGAIEAARRLLQGPPHPQGRIRLVDSSGVPGPSHARNVAAEATEADLLLFCDADDVVDVEWVWRMSEALQSADIARGRLDPSRNPHGRAPAQGDAAMPNPIFGHLGYGPMSNLGVRREVYRAVGGAAEDLRIGEDVDFCWRAQYAGYTFAVAAKATVYLRWRSTLRGHFTQALNWGRGDVELLTRHRQYGARPTPVWRFVAQVVKLVPHLMLGLFDGPRRWVGVQRAGKILGRSIESLRTRRWSV